MRKILALACLALGVAVFTAREAKAQIPYDTTKFPFVDVASHAWYLYDDGTHYYGYTVLTAGTAGTTDPCTHVFTPYVFVYLCFIGPSPVDPTLVPTGTIIGAPPLPGVVPFDPGYGPAWLIDMVSPSVIYMTDPPDWSLLPYRLKLIPNPPVCP